MKNKKIQFDHKMLYLSIIPFLNFILGTTFVNGTPDLGTGLFIVFIIFPILLIVNLIQLIIFVVKSIKKKNIKYLILPIISISLFFIPIIINEIKTENLQRPNENIELKNIYEIEEFIPVNNEDLYMIVNGIDTNDNTNQYLVKYNISNEKFEVICDNAEKILYGDGLLFFDNADNGFKIYMLDTKSNDVNMIISKRYRPNNKYYYDGKLYFDSYNNAFYNFNTKDSKIRKFKLPSDSNVEDVLNNLVVISSKKKEPHNFFTTTSYYLYDFNGKLIKKLTYQPRNEYYFQTTFLHNDYLYSFDKDLNDYTETLIINNIKDKKSFEYKFNKNDIYFDESNQYTIVNWYDCKFLGVYNNKMYIKLQYNIKNTNSNLYSKYENIYYFDISNLADPDNIKLHTLDEALKSEIDIIESETCLFDKYIYISKKNGNLFRYDLENNYKSSEYNIGEGKVSYSSNANYMYILKEDHTIYRIDKNNFTLEKILDVN